MKVGDIYNPYKVHVGSHIPNAILRLRELSFGAKLVFARLGQYAGEDGRCFPKQETLANELGSSLSAIKRFLNELVDKQFIVKETPKGQDRYMHKTIRYSFCWHECFEENFFPQPETDLSPKQTSTQSETGLPAQSKTEPSGQSETDLSNLRESKKEKKRKRIKERSSKSKTPFSTNQEKSPSPPLRGTPPPQISGSEEQASNIPSNNRISETNPNIPDQSQTPAKPEITFGSEGDSNISQIPISNLSNNNIEIELVEFFYAEMKKSVPDSQIPKTPKGIQEELRQLRFIIDEGRTPELIKKAIQFVFEKESDGFWVRRVSKLLNLKNSFWTIINQMAQKEEKEKFFID